MADVVAVFHKNQREEVRVGLTVYQGRELLDVRVYAEFRDAGPERRPTKAGISIRAEQIPELRRAINAAEAEARARGLLKPENWHDEQQVVADLRAIAEADLGHIISEEREKAHAAGVRP